MARTYRVRGIPLDWDFGRVRAFLAENSSIEPSRLDSLAREVHGRSQSATISIQNTGNPPPRQIRLPASGQPTRSQVVTIDDDFHGITTLYAPPPQSHRIDVIALSGLGGHAFGSFKQRGEEYMWIRDSLPYDLISEDEQAAEIGRVMIYGYDSTVKDSTSFQNLEDLAISARDLLLPVTSGAVTSRPIIFIAHSLGGLILKQLLIILSKSQIDEDLNLLRLVYGVAFFGVPHDGMDIRSLIAMATDAPNQFLVESIGNVNSQILNILRRDFHHALGEKGGSEVICFYETRESPTPKQDSNGTWKMNGPNAVLVTRSSATHGRYWEEGPEYVCPIDCTHSEIVKFGPQDHEYEKVLQRLRGLVKRALAAPRRLGQTSIVNTLPEAGPGPTPNFYIPLARNNRFTGRTVILENLEKTFFGENPSQRAALVGLGGVGKTQVALHFAYRLKATRTDYSIYWVPLLSEQSVTQAYTEIARRIGLKKSNKDDEEDIKTLVCRHLGSGKAGKWLLIADNADDQELLFGGVDKPGIEEYLPESEDGLVLLTTRSGQVAVDFAGSDVIDIEKMSRVEATQLLEASMNRKELVRDDAVADLLDYLTFLPLAITQAAAYLNKTRAPLQQYLKLLRGAEKDVAKVLGREFRDQTRYQESRNAVGTTWLVSFDQIERSDPVAVRLLSFMSLIEPKAIPRTILPVQEPEELEWAIGTLCSYSFLLRQGESNLFDMHSLVHMAARGWLQMRRRKEAALIEAIGHLAEIFPPSDRANRGTWRSYLPHTIRLLSQVGKNQMGDVYRLSGKVADCLDHDRRFKEAVTYYEDVCRWMQEHLEEDNHHRLVSEHALASAYLNDRRITDAIKIFEHVMAVRKETLGEKDHARLASEHALARAYLDDRRITDAIEIFEHVVAIQKETLGEKDHARLLSEHELARAYLDDRRITDAIKIFEHVMAVRKETLGEKDHARLASEHALASAYLNDRRITDAIKIFEHVVAVRKETLGEKDHARLASEHALASAYLENRRIADAIEIFEHVVAVQKETLGERDYARLASEYALARVYLENRRIADAIEIFEHVVAVQKETLDEKDYARLVSEHALASAYLADGQIGKAITLLDHVVAVEKELLLDNDPDKLLSINLLADANNRFINRS